MDRYSNNDVMVLDYRDPNNDAQYWSMEVSSQYPIMKHSHAAVTNFGSCGRQYLTCTQAPKKLWLSNIHVEVTLQSSRNLVRPTVGIYNDLCPAIWQVKLLRYYRRATGWTSERNIWSHVSQKEQLNPYLHKHKA